MKEWGEEKECREGSLPFGLNLAMCSKFHVMVLRQEKISLM